MFIEGFVEEEDRSRLALCDSRLRAGGGRLGVDDAGFLHLSLQVGSIPGFRFGHPRPMLTFIYGVLIIRKRRPTIICLRFLVHPWPGIEIESKF